MELVEDLSRTHKSENRNISWAGTNKIETKNQSCESNPDIFECINTLTFDSENLSRKTLALSIYIF